MSDMPLPGYRKAGGWPVTAQLQAWLGLAVSPLAAAGMLAASRGESAAFALGALLAALAVVPHEHLHVAAARVLGLKARISWSGLMPHSQSEGVLRLWQVPVTGLAPQLVTLGLIAGAAALRSPVLAASAISHAALSTGDFAHAAYAALSALRPVTRRRVLLNGTGPEAGLYEPSGSKTEEPPLEAPPCGSPGGGRNGSQGRAASGCAG